MARVALVAAALLSMGGALACVPNDDPGFWGDGPDTGVGSPDIGVGPPDAGVAAEDLASRSPECTRTFQNSFNGVGSTLIPSRGQLAATAMPLAASAFVVDFDVALEGDVTFFPAAPGEEIGGLPSITRSGADLVLGNWTYGADPVLVAGGFFSGQHLAAKALHLTVFVEADASRLAMRVEAGGASFWSGFTTTSPAPHGLVLATEPGPATNAGSSSVRVGAILGCERPITDDCTTAPIIGFCREPAGSTPPF
jgi:hypothetical protein